MQTLRLFCDVVRLRSFSAAAEGHGITQSAASQRIGQLERKLGVMLIDRSERPLGLTEAGKIFLEGAMDLVQRYDRLEQKVTKLRPKPSGNVRVAAIYSAGIDLLNHVRETFEQQHPDVTVVIHYERPEQVVEAVQKHECDLGIVSYPQTWREVGVIPLRDERMAVVCSPAHELARHKKIHASALDGLAMLNFEAQLPVARRIKRYLKDHAAHPQFISEFDKIDTIKSAVVMTNHLAILPKRTVMREVSAGTLIVIELEPRLTRPIGIIHRRRGRQGSAFHAAAQAFVDHLIEHAGPSVDLVAQAQHAGHEFAGAKS